MKFLEKLFRKKQRFFTVFKVSPWEDRDRVALNEFLQTETGRRFMEVLATKGAYQNMMACTERKGDTAHACGVANGYEQARADIVYLAMVSTDQATVNSEPTEEEIEEKLKEMTNG